MTSDRLIEAFHVSMNIAQAPWCVCAINVVNAISATAAGLPRLIGVDASLGGEHAVHAKLDVYRKTDAGGLDFNDLSYGDGIVDYVHELYPDTLAVRMGASFVNADAFPGLDLESVWGNCRLYQGRGGANLPTTTTRMRSWHLSHGRAATWRAQSGAGIKMPTGLNDGCVAIITQLSAPTRVSVTLYAEVPTA
jgi:hypothetical protein